jgi:hypothetical protein
MRRRVAGVFRGGKSIDETLAKARPQQLNFVMPTARPVLLATLWLLALPAGAATVGVEFFEQRIRPVLVGECYECHSAAKTKGGLRVDYRDGLLKGGEHGPAIAPGDARASLLLQAIRHDHPELRMPKNGAKLSETILKDFADWVNARAPDPRDQPPGGNAVASATWDAVLAVRRQWWSFQPVRKPAVPTPTNATWSALPMDRFLLEKMEERGLQPAPPADPRVLVRRLHFALTGLPPRPDEVETFVRDFQHDPQRAVEQRADQLLASPHFGERWARHWMDLVRYAESHGSEGDPEIPRAWRYRDHLIRAFNADVPLDQLIRAMDETFGASTGDAAVEAAIRNYETAYRMQAAEPELCDLRGEGEATQRLYGVDSPDKLTAGYAKQCLVARRLIERGVRFVELSCLNASIGAGNAANPWDQHSKVKEGHGAMARQVDQPIAGLIRDLKARGLLDDTLILFSGEFGRTPFSQGSDGRDHNPHGFSLWLAGGGIKGGTACGATDDLGYHAVENKCEIYDLYAAVLHLLGLNHEKLTFRFGGRDFRLTDVHGHVIQDILA